MKEKLKNILIGCVLGGVAVFGVTRIFPAEVYRAEIFREGDKPPVMRLYRNFAKDSILRESRLDDLYFPPSRIHGVHHNIQEYKARTEK